MIPLNDCQNGYLYRIFARNFSLGVFCAESRGFIGIRNKFGCDYLFTEYHFETGPPCGTVTPHERLEKVPEGIILSETLGTKDQVTGRPVAFDRPKDQGGKGWYFTDTGLPGKIDPIYSSNPDLFKWLQAQRQKYLKD